MFKISENGFAGGLDVFDLLVYALDGAREPSRAASKTAASFPLSARTSFLVIALANWRTACSFSPSYFRLIYSFTSSLIPLPFSSGPTILFSPAGDPADSVSSSPPPARQPLAVTAISTEITAVPAAQSVGPWEDLKPPGLESSLSIGKGKLGEGELRASVSLGFNGSATPLSPRREAGKRGKERVAVDSIRVFSSGASVSFYYKPKERR